MSATAAYKVVYKTAAGQIKEAILTQSQVLTFANLIATNQAIKVAYYYELGKGIIKLTDITILKSED